MLKNREPEFGTMLNIYKRKIKRCRQEKKKLKFPNGYIITVLNSVRQNNQYVLFSNFFLTKNNVYIRIH